MKSLKLKLSLALTATLLIGFAGGFATKSCLDFFKPTLTASYSSGIINPEFNQRSLLPAGYNDFCEPFDFQSSLFDFDKSFAQTASAPSIKTEDTAKELKLIAELPGIEQKNVQVDIKPGSLKIKGKQVEKDGERITTSQSFIRSMNLPDNVDSRQAHQDFKDGVLTISIPKIDSHDTQSQSHPSLTSSTI